MPLSANRPKYVFDTSPSILLLEKCGLKSQLLGFAKDNVLVAPNRVLEEYAIGDKESPKPDVSSFKEVFSLVNVELNKDLLPFFNYDASSGEIWVMSYVQKHPDFVCVIDESFGRNVCALLDINVIGAVGVVREMKKSRCLNCDELIAIRDRIKKCRFYLSKELLRQLDFICDT